MMTHVLTCAWIMLMPWNTPKQERNGATSQNFAEGARMETWAFHDISIPLTLMSISRKSPRRTAMSHGISWQSVHFMQISNCWLYNCERIWASKCSVSTSGSIDRRTRWIDMVTKSCWWCDVFELFSSNNLDGKILKDWCCNSFNQGPWCLLLDPAAKLKFELDICSILWYLHVYLSDPMWNDLCSQNGMGTGECLMRDWIDQNRRSQRLNDAMFADHG